MKIFITGGAGFIGSYITRELLASGDEVVIHDAFLNYISPFESNYERLLNLRFKGILDKVKIIRGDIRHKGRFLKILNEEKPDSVINLAALPISTASNLYSEDAMGINLSGTVNILESIREARSVKRFVYASSSMIYGNFQYSPADEKHPTNPLDVYGGTKLSGETLTKVFSKQYGIDYVIVRPSAVYGPTDVNRRVTQLFIESALKSKPLVLHNGGEAKLDFTYVEDIAHGFVLALKSDKSKNETFNITRGEGRSLKELASILQNLIPGTKIISEPVPPDEKRPDRGALDIKKAKKLLGYEPLYSLEEGMKKYVEFVKNSGIIK